MLEYFPVPPLTKIEFSETVTALEISNAIASLKNFNSENFASIILVKNNILPDIIQSYFDNNFESQYNDGGYDIDIILEDDTTPETLATASDDKWECRRFISAYDNNNPIIDITLLTDPDNQVVVHKLYIYIYNCEIDLYYTKCLKLVIIV